LLHESTCDSHKQDVWFFRKGTTNVCMCYLIWQTAYPYVGLCSQLRTLFPRVAVPKHCSISTMHNDAKVSLSEHQKPEIILFYNDTKGGVDTKNQMCRHTCESGTRRWPMAMFYNLVDIDVALNAFVIWKKTESPMATCF